MAAKQILKMTDTEARSFLLKGKSYCKVDLPPYFKLDSVIGNLAKHINAKELKSIFKDGANPRNYDNVNYKLINNKDGKYAWRPFELIHPALYVFLVFKITEENNWKSIVNRFTNFYENQRIQCMSLPIQSNTEKSDKAQIITYWCNQVEKNL